MERNKIPWGFLTVTILSMYYIKVTIVNEDVFIMVEVTTVSETSTIKDTSDKGNS